MIKEVMVQVVNAIKQAGERKDILITNKNMSQKLNVSEKEFLSWLDGDIEPHNDIPFQLQNAYLDILEYTMIKKVMLPPRALTPPFYPWNNSKDDQL